MILDHELETADAQASASIATETTLSKSVALSEAFAVHKQRELFPPSIENRLTRSTANRMTQSDPLIERIVDQTAEPHTGVIRPRFEKAQSGRFVLHEFWEGVVDEVYRTYFVARLISQSSPNPPEVAEIFMEEVSPADLRLVRPGAVFYWAIGYADSASGQRSRKSMIRFRRLPSIIPLKRGEEDAWIRDTGDKWLR